MQFKLMLEPSVIRDWMRRKRLQNLIADIFQMGLSGEIGQFFEQKVAYQFCIFNINIKKYKMRLRHKKPLNSYAGQANHDSSSIHDEDFEKSHNLSKKLKVFKAKPVSEQTKKYAEILLDFVGMVNQNYRSHGKNKQVSGTPSARNNKNRMNFEPSEKINNIPLNRLEGKPEVVSKQYQNIRKSEQRVSKLPPATKKIKKDRIIVEEPLRKKQIKQLNSRRNLPAPEDPKLQKTKLIDLTEGENLNKPSNTRGNLATHQSPEKIFPNMLYNPTNPVNFSSMQFPYMMMNIPNPEAMKSPQNMQYLNQIQNMLQLLSMNFSNSQGGMGNQYIPFEKLPFAQKPFKPDLPQNPQSHNKSLPRKSEETPKTRNSANLLQPIAHMATSAEEKKKENITKVKETENIPNFSRNASNHISIAYNIHFHNLRKKGILQNQLAERGNEELNVIDPTYPARKIREEKKSSNGSLIKNVLSLYHP